MKPQMLVFQILLFFGIAIHLLFSGLNLDIDPSFTIVIPHVVVLTYLAFSLNYANNYKQLFLLFFVIFVFAIADMLSFSEKDLQLRGANLPQWIRILAEMLLLVSVLYEKSLSKIKKKRTDRKTPMFIWPILILVFLVSSFTISQSVWVFYFPQLIISAVLVYFFNFRRHYISIQNYWIGLTGSLLFYFMIFLKAASDSIHFEEDPDFGLHIVSTILFFHGSFMMVASLTKHLYRRSIKRGQEV